MRHSFTRSRRGGTARIGAVIERFEVRCLLTTLPTGFAENPFVSGLNQPTAMEIAPDGRIFVTEQTGALRVIKDGQLLATPFATFDVDSFFERGLLGIAFDPDFATNQFLYVYYTVNGAEKHNRVSRLTANGDLMVPGSEQVILELNTLNAGNHNGGAIHFGIDGKLYIATGDNAVGANAQSLSNLLGKILRINSDGTIPEDNPFYATATGDNRAIWAYGLRNPFTFAFNPGTSRMMINDVGQSRWEEINAGITGSNYGWPSTEGPTTNPNFRAPIFAYPHGGSDPNISGTAITGGVFYSPQTATFPAEFVGDYFFADYGNRWIRRLDLSTNSVSAFATSVNKAVVDLKVTPAGDLLVLQYDFGSTGIVTRIGAVSTAPSVTQDPEDAATSIGGSAEFTVTATGAEPLSYQWQRNEIDIPNANSSILLLADVQAIDDGALFRCVVTNDGGSDVSNSATLTVTSNRVPVPVILTPASGSRYRAGDLLTFSGSATDPDEGQLPATMLSWRIDFHHDTHSHPFFPETSGISSGEVTIPTTGETATNVFYRITLTATDSSGVTTSTTRDITPMLVSQSLDANVPGVALTLDDQPFNQGQSFSSVVGVVRSIATTAAQTINSQTYQFVRWSDGGTLNHDVTAPARTNALVAIFRRLSDSDPVVASFSATNGTLTITSNSASNVTVGIQSGNILVRNHGVGVTSLGNLPAAQVKRIALIGSDADDKFDLTAINASVFPALTQIVGDLGEGDDFVTSVANWSGASSLLGGAGRDTLVGGNGADLLLGDSDQDYLYGGGGMDTLVGAEGDDTLRGGGGNDLLDGGSGNDLLLEAGDADFVLTVSAMTGRDSDSIRSTERAQITGGPGDNLLDASGFGSRVTLIGSGGNDTLRGGGGNDMLWGDDFSINGSAGNDMVLAGGGNDTVLGGGGNDNLNGQNGNDSIIGENGDDVVVGGAGLDILAGGAGNDFLSGQTEAGLLLGGEGSDTLLGNTANDTLYGEQGDDLVIGGGGADWLLGAAGADSLNGGAGADTLQGDLGNDTIDGGADFDRINEVFDTDVTIVGITITSVNLGADAVAAVERIQISGGSANNFFDARQATVPVFLAGSIGNDTLLGGSKADGIVGGDGDDVLSGGGGNDVLEGSAGTDYVFEQADTNFTINGVTLTSSATGSDTPTTVERIVLIGGISANKLDATLVTIPVVLIGGRGNDTLLGGSQSDTLSGGNRNDSTVAGSDGVDSLNGGSGGADVLENDPADTLVLGAGDTTITDVFTQMPSWVDAL